MVDGRQLPKPTLPAGINHNCLKKITVNQVILKSCTNLRHSERRSTAYLGGLARRLAHEVALDRDVASEGVALGRSWRGSCLLNEVSYLSSIHLLPQPFTPPLQPLIRLLKDSQKQSWGYFPAETVM